MTTQATPFRPRSGSEVSDHLTMWVLGLIRGHLSDIDAVARIAVAQPSLGCGLRGDPCQRVIGRSRGVGTPDVSE
jgi:hypothetical protein